MLKWSHMMPRQTKTLLKNSPLWIECQLKTWINSLHRKTNHMSFVTIWPQSRHQFRKRSFNLVWKKRNVILNIKMTLCAHKKMKTHMMRWCKELNRKIFKLCAILRTKEESKRSINIWTERPVMKITFFAFDKLA